MLATTLIYLIGLALCLAAGTAVSALLRPGERWLAPATPALGAATILVASHLFGFVMNASLTLVAICLLAVVALVLALRRTGSRRTIIAALRPSGGEAVLLTLGVALGALLLSPLFSIGFPTIVAVDIADGWVRSVLSDWLLHNPLSDSVSHVALDRPVGSYSGVPPHLAAGYEYLVAHVATLTGQQTYETALPVAALAAPIAVGGWGALYEAATQKRPGWTEAIVLATAGLAPTFVLPLVENYLTQFLSLALWPFAIAATLDYAKRPTLKTALPAALGIGGIAAVYPPMLPFLVPVVVVVVLACATDAPHVARRLLKGLRGRLVSACAALVTLGVAVVAVAPIAVARAYESVFAYGAELTANGAFPLYPLSRDLAVVLGGRTQFELPPYAADPSPWQILPDLALLLGAAAVGAVALALAHRPARRPLLAATAGVCFATGLLYLKYKHGDDYGYGTNKALISGGALLAGLLAVALVGGSASFPQLRLLAAGVCLALWAPATAGLLREQRTGEQGFREPEHALLGAMERLPRNDVVLVEGAADAPEAFVMRMTAGYGAATHNQPVDGIGTTKTYFTAGGAPGWRPRRPWRYVISRVAPSPFSARRRTLWRKAPYAIQAAPALDVTPYAISPSVEERPGTDGRRFWLAAPSDAPAPIDYIAGPVELVVGNRRSNPARAKLELELVAVGKSRMVRIGQRGARLRRIRVQRKRPTSVSLPLVVPARSTTTVTLEPGRPASKPDKTLIPLVGLTRVGLS